MADDGLNFFLLNQCLNLNLGSYWIHNLNLCSYRIIN